MKRGEPIKGPRLVPGWAIPPWIRNINTPRPDERGNRESRRAAARTTPRLARSQQRSQPKEHNP